MHPNISRIMNHKATNTPADNICCSQKDEQKVNFICFLIAAEGTDPKASAGVPAGGPDNPNTSCSVRQHSEVGSKQYHVLYVFQLSVCAARSTAMLLGILRS